MPFIYKDNGNANGDRVLVKAAIADSQTLTIGEAVTLSAGKIVTCPAGTAVFGIVAGLYKADGSPLTDNGAGGAFVDTYTTPSSNTVYAMVDVSTTSRYSVVADATLGTTTGSDKMGYNIDNASGAQTLSESSTVSTTAQYFIWGADTDPLAPANSLIVSIQESQVKI